MTQQIRVLLTDDSQSDASALALELGRALQDSQGLQTRWVESAQQMYQAIEEWLPDIVLSDVHMPRFDIFAALATIRQRWPLLPVVVVSGLVGEEFAARLIKAGANDFVAKTGAARLGAVVERELRDARQNLERAELAARLRRQEGLFQNVMAHLPVGVWLFDENGAVMHGNPAALAIWDAPADTPEQNFPPPRGWWADSGQPLKPEDWATVRALRNDETSIDERIEIETFAGARKVMLNSAVPLRGDDGQMLGCFVVNQDITALHHTEQRLRRTERTLRGLSQRQIEAQEQQRRWIAQELHDDIGQAIAAMRLQLGRIAEQSREPLARQMATEALQSSSS